MWSLEMIDYLNQEAARDARQQEREPYVPALHDIAMMPPFPFPNLGPHVPPSWERVEDATWFVDSSGWGDPSEPALTAEEFRSDLRAYIQEHPGHGFGIIECGQFQCHVAAFERAA